MTHHIMNANYTLQTIQIKALQEAKRKRARLLTRNSHGLKLSTYKYFYVYIYLTACVANLANASDT